MIKQRIKFEQIDKSWFLIALLILSVVFIILGFFEILKFDNPKINRIIGALGHTFLILFFSRSFWFKNYVQWNRKGIVIKIKSFLGKSIAFEDIKESIFEDGKLTIYKRDVLKIEFNLSHLEENDSLRLNEIINENCL